ncbi:MAG: hypothetical protein H0V09_03615 [Gemmatimonadetes bacterium]|nr:hypothetical protein [Gemmatimonadota bacterium]
MEFEPHRRTFLIVTLLAVLTGVWLVFSSPLPTPIRLILPLVLISAGGLLVASSRSSREP